MRSLYARWMLDWENRLCSRATNRVVRPFEWGLEWTSNWPVTERHPPNGGDPHAYLKILNRAALEASDKFFAYRPPSDFKLTHQLLEFTSAVNTPYSENDLVRAQWFPAAHKNARRRVAAIVLPHWNAQRTQHNALCAGLAKLGISTLRLSLPYHDYRMPAELERADYAVSSNIARTIDATRQAVIDTRSCADWLEREGFESIGLVGTSLGSCYAFLASSHDLRLRVNVFNHCSTYFADVVWEGLSTRHIRQSIEAAMTLDQLREAWMAISPPCYIDRYARLRKKPLFIYARYDTTFPTHLSEQVIKKARELRLDHEAVVMPCGHYSLGQTPFKFIDGYYICRFLKKHL
ncbi:MAG: alpha/beta hydrolase family protein [Bryobacterales bacterium]|nr:alpha/beta hydrolase family protein [Bryobacterales bacterium]MBV9400187.1 alpha/beta hydrolase family protein [Bryobacterales bacterium]